MKFELRNDGHPLGNWAWDVTVKGEKVATGPDFYETEQEARSAIAKARKAFGGYKFAKVVIMDPEPEDHGAPV